MAIAGTFSKHKNQCLERESVEGLDSAAVMARGIAYTCVGLLAIVG